MYCYINSLYSRDTSIKLWDIHDFSELRSLGFHKDAVTGVKILPQDDELLSDMAPSEQSKYTFQYISVYCMYIPVYCKYIPVYSSIFMYIPVLYIWCVLRYR